MDKTKMLIVYATDYGSTQKMAEALQKGASSVRNTEVSLKQAESVTLEETAECHALVLGSPVHMGSMDWRIKRYIDTICSKLWMKDTMVGKVGGVFASGGGFGSAGGGCELALLSMLNNLVELGLLIVPLPKNTPGYSKGGLQWGPYGRSTGENMEQIGISEDKTEAAWHHGAHIARTAGLIKDKKIFLQGG